MKLLEAKGVDAIEMIAELMEPIAEISQDKEIGYCLHSNQAYKAVMYAMKKHPKTVLKLMAICEGVPVEEYAPSVPEIPAKVLEIINHPSILPLFTSQSQIEETYSGSATENIEEKNQ